MAKKTKKPELKEVVEEVITNNRVDFTDCERDFGQRVGRLAACWQEYGKDLMFVNEILLHKFVTNDADCKEDVERYKKGSLDLPAALQECYEEIKLKEAQEEEKRVEEEIDDVHSKPVIPRF